MDCGYWTFCNIQDAVYSTYARTVIAVGCFAAFIHVVTSMTDCKCVVVDAVCVFVCWTGLTTMDTDCVNVLLSMQFVCSYAGLV